MKKMPKRRKPRQPSRRQCRQSRRAVCDSQEALKARRRTYDADYEFNRQVQGLGTITFRPTEDDLDAFQWLQVMTGNNRSDVIRQALNVYCQVLDGAWVPLDEHLAVKAQAASRPPAPAPADALTALLPKLIRLSHPDKHNGSRLATDVTQALLQLRAKHR